MLSFFNSPSILHPFFPLSVNWNCQSASLWWTVSSRKLCRTCQWHSKNWCVLFENAYLVRSGSVRMQMQMCVCVYMCVIASHLILLISGEAFKRVLPALKQQDQCPTAKSGGASVSYWWGQLVHSSHTPNPHLFNTHLHGRKYYTGDPLCKIISSEYDCFF